jgi:general secretion pathway protein G
MRQPISSSRTKRNPLAGLTLLELILTIAILLILSSTALPLAQVTVKREKELELRRDLREMRTAIDRYKDAADRNLIRVEVGTQGYPPDLQTLVNGVTIGAGGTLLPGAAPSQTGQSGSDVASKVRFLRKIPVDPMTGRTDWGLRGVEDDPDSQAWGGHDVFDVYSQSTGTALDGTKYSDW